VLTVHDIDFLERRGAVSTVARVYKSAMLRAALRKGPAAVVCESAFSRRALLERFPAIDEDRTRVIYPGVTPTATAWAGGGEPPYFLTVSTIIPRKNHLRLLEAFRRARRAGLRADWLVAGTPGPGSAAIVNALRSEPGVRMLGAVDSRELGALYGDALFLATPSAAEGFGYTPLEAMAVGTPILASDGGALPEVIGDAGLVLPAADVDAWAGALVQLAEDTELRERLSIKGHKRAAAFTWERAAGEVVDLYRHALEGAPQRPSSAQRSTYTRAVRVEREGSTDG
jgi:glycosyltransferase involved in cell wall biosynthesis